MGYENRNSPFGSGKWNDFVLSDGTEMMPSMEQKCSTNQRNKNDLNGNHLVRTNGTHLMFGEYRNVFLTEKEYKRLKADFSGLDSLIEQLSAYIQSTGRKYADHAATPAHLGKTAKVRTEASTGHPGLHIHGRRKPIRSAATLTAFGTPTKMSTARAATNGRAFPPKRRQRTEKSRSSMSWRPEPS